MLISINVSLAAVHASVKRELRNRNAEMRKPNNILNKNFTDFSQVAFHSQSIRTVNAEKVYYENSFVPND